jgi:DNA-binding response OmpR family regulator
MEKARILIVDTDSLTSSMLKAAYEKKGASVDVITDPNKVVEQFKTGRYNMVILDSLPPLHKGFDYCQKIRAIKGGEKIPLLMTSISSDDSYARKAISAGATAYEAKPFSVTAFANRSLELMNQQLEAAAPPPPRSEPVAAPPPSKPQASPPAAPPPAAPTHPGHQAPVWRQRTQ